MAAPPERRPQRVLAQLIEKLETTKPSAGLVDPATDFAVCRQFALSVYARADKHDVRSAQTATADADAGRGVLSRGNLPQDAGPVAIRGNVRRRSETQARVRGVAGVGPGDGDARGTSTVAGGRARQRAARRFIFQPRVHRAAVVAAGPGEFAGVSVAGEFILITVWATILTACFVHRRSLNVSTPDHSTTPTRPGSSVSSNAPLPPRPPPPPGAPPPGHRSPSMEPCTSPKSSDDQRWEPRW